jgi:hypothetical protein
MRKLTHEIFLEKANRKHNNFYTYPEEYQGWSIPIKIICPKHGEFSQEPGNHMSRSGCQKCSVDRKTKTKDKFEEDAKEIHGEKYKYHLVEYKTAHTPIKIWCPIHGEFEQTPNAHLAGKGCDDCGGSKLKTTAKFIQEANDVHDYFYTYPFADYKNAFTPIKICCPIHGEFEQPPHSHLTGYGCGTCGGTKLKTLEEFIEEAELVHDKKYTYPLAEYKGGHVPIKICCPKHGEFEQPPSSHLAGHGCPKCITSRGEIKILGILKKLSIKNKPQYKNETCRGKKWLLPFDFGILDDDGNVLGLIEYQGVQHFRPIYFGKGMTKEAAERSFNDLQITDKIKKEWCKKNKIPLLCLRYDEDKDLRKNLEKFLKKCFKKSFLKRLKDSLKNIKIFFKKIF